MPEPLKGDDGPNYELDDLLIHWMFPRVYGFRRVETVVLTGDHLIDPAMADRYKTL